MTTKNDLLKMAVYVQYPIRYNEYNTYSTEKEIHRLPLTVKENMWCNHFIGKYHREFSLPMIAKILKFDYNENDFTLKERYSEGHEISSLIPKKEYRYEIYGFDEKEHFDNIDFNELTTCNIKSPLQDYHRQYKYPHQNSRIINKTINSDRKLFISGDSQMIPDIPVLSCYFKEIWYADNRNGLTLSNEWGKIDFTDVLIELNHIPLGNYINKNLR